MTEFCHFPRAVTRRRFVRDCAATALLSVPVMQSWGDRVAAGQASAGAAMGTLSLDHDWFFGGRWLSADSPSGRRQSRGQAVTLPHTVVPLSWQNWDPTTWEARWIYERQFAIPREFHGLRLFLHFERVLAAATPTVNGHALQPHQGGFLPFDREITALVQAGDNALAVVVDAGWLNVPPTGNPKGTPSVDYLLPGGITGSVTLRALPEIYISDVFAKPMNVLQPTRRLDLICRIDTGELLPAPVRLEARLLDRGMLVAKESSRVTLETADQEVSLTLSSLPAVHLWSPETPSLYDVEVTLYRNNRPVHRFVRRVGFRDARFTVDGFFLNGDRLRIFGLDRHELYPYLGFAAPNRLLRRDAAILRREFNCNTVRCSHYPQSEAFLDACDELGLMVWEEVPGWQYIGDQAWQDLVVQDAEAMIRRDRSHPSIIIWGVRVNESANDPKLYERTTALARTLDGTRPASGSMTPDSRRNWETEWHEDVFAFDDYHSAPDGSVAIDPPLAGVPCMLAETVGQRTYGGAGFHNQYRRAGDIELQQKQAIYHAQAHDRAANFERLAGVIAWCAVDYASQMNSYHNVKCPGVADVFRFPKLGAAFYLSQVDPQARPVIEPNFYWDSTVGTLSTTVRGATIFSNCDQLEVSVGGARRAILHPDRAGFPNLRYPPFLIDLDQPVDQRAELRIDGTVRGAHVLSRRFSPDRSMDRLWLRADDEQLHADGADATRLAFGIVDRFGNPRSTATGPVQLSLEGPGEIVGDNPFSFEDAGGLGAVYIRTRAGESGIIKVAAIHAVLGKASITIAVRI